MADIVLVLFVCRGETLVNFRRTEVVTKYECGTLWLGCQSTSQEAEEVNDFVGSNALRDNLVSIQNYNHY